MPISLFVSNKTGEPALRFRVDGGEPYRPCSVCSWRFETNVAFDFAPLREIRHKWQDFVLHVVYNHDDPNVVGLTELWRNGVLEARIVGPNMYEDEKLTFMVGNYRNPLYEHSSAVIHDGWRMGNSYAAVSP